VAETSENIGETMLCKSPLLQRVSLSGLSMWRFRSRPDFVKIEIFLTEHVARYKTFISLFFNNTSYNIQRKERRKKKEKEKIKKEKKKEEFLRKTI
jgi:hypothetical protein